MPIDLATVLLRLYMYLLLQDRCGLPLHTYFSALKIKWMIEHLEGVRAAINEGRCFFGTVDSWIIWVSLKSL